MRGPRDLQPDGALLSDAWSGTRNQARCTDMFAAPDKSGAAFPSVNLAGFKLVGRGGHQWRKH
jgi:hypothetical protein